MNVNNLIKYGIRKGADYIQVNNIKSDIQKINISENSFNQITTLKQESYIISTWVNKKRSVVTSNKLNEEVVDNAVKLAKLYKSDEYFFGLPSKNKKNNVKGIYSKKIADASSEDIAKAVKDFLNKTKKIKITEGDFRLGVRSSFVINSEGVDLNEKTTSLVFDVDVGYHKNGKISSYFDMAVSRDFIKLDQFAKHITDKTLFYLNRKEFKAEIDGVVLMPDVLNGLFEDALSHNFNVMSLKNKDGLFEKTGSNIISEKISITDDAKLENGFSSYGFDYEGNLSQSTKIVDAGVFKNFITNYNLSKCFKLSNTGNAGVTSPNFSNIILNGEGVKNIFEYGKRFLVVDGILASHTSNDITTEFSVKAGHAYLLEKNKKIPIHEAMLSGKFVDCLKQVHGFCFEEQEKGGFISKALLFEKDAVNVIK